MTKIEKLTKKLYKEIERTLGYSSIINEPEIIITLKLKRLKYNGKKLKVESRLTVKKPAHIDGSSYNPNILKS